MPTTSPEDDLHAHAPIDGAELTQPDLGMDPPEHISMNDLGYVAHLINNAITAIKSCIDYEGNDPSIEEDLKQSKEITVGRINFLLTRYEEDLRNMPELRDFLELLLYLVQNDQFKHACKLHQLGAKVFKLTALTKPGRHLSQTEMAVAKEGQEAVPTLDLTVVGSCKNLAGLYVGLSQAQRTKLGVEKGGTVELFDDKNKSLGVFTVGAGSSEYVDHTDLFTANGIPESALVTVRKSITDPSKPKELNFPAIHSVETIDAEKHAERKGKIAQRFPDLDAQAYIVLPTPVASELLGVQPQRSEKTGKLILPISRGRVKVDDKETDIAIVPSGQTVGFTSAAAQKLNIPSELSKIKIIIDKGVLIIA